MKAKYDIYIRKDIQESLDKEPNMSGLINDLLARHFDKVYQKQEDLATVGISSKVTHEFKDNKVVTKVTPDPKDVLEVVRFCPNGHAIPKGRNKCMGKGCKYA